MNTNSEKHIKRINMAFNMACETHPLCKKGRMVAMLYINNELASVGIPRPEGGHFSFRYNKHGYGYFHAETDAINQAIKAYGLSYIKNKRSILYIARAKDINPNKRPKFIYSDAMPCYGCTICLLEHNINHVFYTVENNMSFDTYFVHNTPSRIINMNNIICQSPRVYS